MTGPGEGCVYWFRRTWLGVNAVVAVPFFLLPFLLNWLDGGSPVLNAGFAAAALFGVPFYLHVDHDDRRRP